MRTALQVTVGGIVLMMLLASSVSRSGAAEWSAEPSMTVRGDYNSNLLLLPGSRESVWGIWLSPGTKFAGSTENLQVSGRVAADFVKYFGETDRALTNLYFPLSVQYMTERETFGFDGGFTRDNTLMGEAIQTGVVVGFTQRNLLTLGPSWTHALTERLSTQVSYQYANATYEDGFRLGLVNYTTQGGSGGLLYQPTEADRVNLSVSYTNFNAPQANDLVSEIYSAQLSLTHNFTETLTGTITGGPNLVHATINAGGPLLSSQSTLFVGSANLKKSWEDASVMFDLGRQIYPSGFGLLVQTDRVGVTVAKDFNEQWSTSLSAFALFASAISTEASLIRNFQDSRYVNITPRVTWKFSQWGQVDFMYSYVNRHVDIVGFADAFANIASVMLTYTPPKLSVGR